MKIWMLAQRAPVNTRLAATLPRYSRELTPNLMFMLRSFLSIIHIHHVHTLISFSIPGLITPFVGTLYENEIYSIVRVQKIKAQTLKYAWAIENGTIFRTN